MMKSKKSFSISFVLSVALHLALAALVWIHPTDIRQMMAKDDRKIEVEILDAEPVLQALQEAQKKSMTQQALTKGQIVEQDKQLNDEIPDNARFLSKHNQKVIRETQAALHGKFKNSDETSGEKTPEKEPGQAEEQGQGAEEKPEVAETEKPKELLTSPEGIPLKTKPQLKDLMPSFKPGLPRVESEDLAKGGGEGPSATDDHLKNVAVGMQTLLSTREFVYYSYYNRIKDKLRQTWEPKIKEKMERILRQGRTIASSSDRVTKIVILLDEKGILQKVQVIGPSGLTDLDDAAVEAFKAAAPFPNPPKGIVEGDGLIRIRWDFILEANAGGFFDAARLAKGPQDYSRN